MISTGPMALLFRLTSRNSTLPTLVMRGATASVSNPTALAMSVVSRLSMANASSTAGLSLLSMKKYPLTNLITVAALCVLTFIPVKFVHPLRVTDWRPVTIPMTVLWAAMSLSLIIQAKDRSDWGLVEDVQLWVWVAASLYFFFISIWRTFFKKDVAEDAAGGTT